MPSFAVSDVTRLLESFRPEDDGEALKSKELIMALLAWSPDPFSRNTYTPGHITCTGVVVSPDRRRVVLVHHNRLDRWLLPGGHCEDNDVSVDGVARREVMEETGVSLAAGAGQLVNVDVHPIPGNHHEPLHLHHDLIFAFQALSVDTQCSEESRAVAWSEAGEFDRYNVPAPIRRAARKAFQ
jgi:8-oxo-dGTP pyrophosphatase MutT (NUDIX family)